MPRLFRLKSIAAFFCFAFIILSLLYFRKHYVNSDETVIVPVSRNNLLIRDGNVDISIEKVDELHVHQEQSNQNFNVKDLVLARVPEVIAFPDSNQPVAATSLHKDESGKVAGVEDRSVEEGRGKGSTGNSSNGGGVEGLEFPVPDINEGNLPFDTSMTGYLNYDVWHWVVGYLVDDLRISKDFPQYPDDRGKVSTLHTEFNEADPADVKGRYGHKIYGYLIPPEEGPYKFRVDFTEMTAAADMELWVGTDSDPLSITKTLELLYDDMKRARSGVRAKTGESRPVKRVPTTKSAESAEVNFDTNVHYFEYFLKAYEGKIKADIKWKTPSSDHYVPIPSDCFAMGVKLDSEGVALDGPLTQFMQGPLPSNHLQSHHRARAVSNTIYKITSLDILPKCEYTSKYARVHRIKPYHGVYEVFESKVEPKDDTWFTHWKKKDKGNPVIPKETVDRVVSLYKKALNASSVKGTVEGLRSLEETVNKEDGSRFLLEMDVHILSPEEEIVHTSEYVYLKKSSTQLCHTSNFQWTKNAEVHFVVSVKNLGLWVRHLIYNMEDIYDETKDDHFSLIIVDYESEDINIEEEAKKSSFKRIEVLHLKGGFSRSGGLQAGINHVQDKNSIVMTIDMHLTLPVGIVEYARRHTVQYKMAFTPMFFRLNKGYTEINYNGFWETLTYGLFSMYKSDWTTFGGFNTRKFKTKWGGEDWDIVDRSLAKGFEAFRIRPPGLVHYHHTRKGMWGNNDIKFPGKKH